MSWVAPIVWLVVAALVFLLTREMMNVGARYRTPAAIVAGALWPLWTVMFAAFLLADLIEWIVRSIVRRLERL